RLTRTVPVSWPGRAEAAESLMGPVYGRRPAPEEAGSRRLVTGPADRIGSHLPEQGDAVLDGRMRVEQAVEPGEPAPIARRRRLDPQVGGGAARRADDGRVVPQLLQCRDEPRWVAGHLHAGDIGKDLPA